MATDRIAIAGPYSLVERSAATFTAKFRDANANVTPANAYYRIDNEDGCEIAGWTALPVAGSTVSVPVSADQNAIRNCTKDQERRTLTVMADRGLATQFAATFGFDVRNQAWRN